MKALIQRVKNASVTVAGKTVGKINAGLLIFLGVGHDDGPQDISYLVNKIINLRIFPPDEALDNPRNNVSLLDVRGEVLIVSQFTLYGDCRKGRRPSYTAAASPELAEELYEKFVAEIAKCGLKTAKGTFGAMMEVKLNNWGPITLLIESQVKR